MNILHSFSRETVIALVFGLFTAKFYKKTIQMSSSTVLDQEVSLKLVDASEALATDELLDLTNVWNDDKPEGKFLRGRHGTTHYVVDRNDDEETSKRGIVVLGHGLGSSLKMYKPFAKLLVNEGYTVLRYDCFGHGYSKANDMWVKYTPDMFVDQLEDLIDFVSKEEQEEVIGYVGHSNGGVNGISAQFRWSSNESARKVIPKMILVNGSVFAKKPLLAKISDSIPTVMTTLMKNIPPMKGLIGDNYLELMTQVFGKDPATNDYNYPDAFKENMERNLRMFGRVKGVNQHPFLAPAILGVSCYNIPEAMLPMHRERLSKLVTMKGDENRANYLYLWSELDVTVPSKDHLDVIHEWAKGNDNLKIKSFPGLSHEIFLEDHVTVANAVLPFLESST